MKKTASLYIPPEILEKFDKLVTKEKWSSRNDAILHLILEAINRGYIDEKRAKILAEVTSVVS